MDFGTIYSLVESPCRQFSSPCFLQLKPLPPMETSRWERGWRHQTLLYLYHILTWGCTVFQILLQGNNRQIGSGSASVASEECRHSTFFGFCFDIRIYIRMFFNPRSWAWASEYTTLHNNDRLLISHLFLIRILSKAKKVIQNMVVAKDSFFCSKILGGQHVIATASWLTAHSRYC